MRKSHFSDSPCNEVVVLQQQVFHAVQVLAQKDHIAEQNQRCKDLEASSRQLEERCSELKESAAGHEVRAKEAAAEVLKGNRIIEKVSVSVHIDCLAAVCTDMLSDLGSLGQAASLAIYAHVCFMWLSASLTVEALSRQASCSLSWVRQPGQQQQRVRHYRHTFCPVMLLIRSSCCTSEHSHFLDQVA